MTDEEAQAVTHSGAELEAAVNRLEHDLASDKRETITVDRADLSVALKGARLARDLMLWIKAKKEGFQ